MGGGDPFIFEMEEGIPGASGDFHAALSETENNNVSPKSGEKISAAPEILDSGDTVWIMDDYMVVDSTSSQGGKRGTINQEYTILEQSTSSHGDEQETMNLEDVRAKFLNQTAVQASSNKFPLFQVMRIVSDKQELSFVEKVHIPEDEIFHLCNQFVPNAAAKCSDIKIDFNSLNDISLPAIGIYGDKQIMAGILKDMKVVDDPILKLMEEGSFEPGLYVSISQEILVVFYWHQGTLLKDASRKEVSCNFIRYVVDLCDDVYVCIEEKDVFDSLTAFVANKSHRRRRTERLKISHVRNSENDVKVSSGWSVSIQKFTMGAFAIAHEGAMVPDRPLFFAEGYHRCAFLSACYKPAKKYVKPNWKKIKVEALCSELQNFSKYYDLDFTKLPDEEFVLLLKHSKMPEFKNYEDLMHSIQDRRGDYLKSNLIEFKLKELGLKILNSILHVLPEYCTSVQYLSDLDASELMARQSIADDKYPTEPSRFEHLQCQLATIWDLNPDKQRVLFTGTEFTFKQKNDEKCVTFVIEKSGNPLVFGREIVLRYKGEDHKTENAKFLPIDQDASGKEFPVVSGVPVLLRFLSKKSPNEGIIELSQTLDGVLRDWIRPSVPKELLSLEQNIVFLGSLMANGMLNERKKFGRPLRDKLLQLKRDSIEKDLLLAFLMSNEDLDKLKSFSTTDMKKFLTAGSLHVIAHLLDSVEVKLSTESLESYLQWKKRLFEFKLHETSSKVLFSIGFFKDLWSSIYKEGKEAFKENVKAMIRKDMFLLLREKIQYEKAAAEKIQEQRFKDEKENFLILTKKNLSQNQVMGRRLHIQRFSVEKRYYYLGPHEVNMQFLTEEEEKPSIQWMIVELVPKKKDLDELSLNSMHGITPSCSDMVELVCCDAETEVLKKVVFLKSGELLIFIHDKEQNSLNLYMVPKLGPLVCGSNPIRIFRRGFDLVAFDERTRFLALFEADVAKIQIYKFDESFRHIDWTGIEILLEFFSGSTNTVWMQFIPGKAELLLIDDSNRARVVELHQHPLMKPKHLSLMSDFRNACVSGDGSFLFVFQRSAEVSEDCSLSSAQLTAQETQSSFETEVKVYMLGDTMSYLKTICLDINVGDIGNLQAMIVHFGCQTHLVVYSDVVPGFISSNLLTLVSATEVLEFQELSKGKQNSEARKKDSVYQDCPKSCAALDYFYHIFDKFAVSPALFRGLIRHLNFNVLLKSKDTTKADLGQRKCEEYLKLLIGQLEQEKGKDFSELSIQFHVDKSEGWDSNFIDVKLPYCQKKAAGNWIRQLICLVPIQVTRAENNGLRPLIDGLQIPPHLTYTDSISLANLMHFGLYDAVLNQWDGKIKVISSMGKQSSGKSYLLNHLSGSLLDVAGGRCTDGVWMTVRVDAECLYVLMDFEGLGSFERTEQEDMLLSVLNAAISNLTIFNKKDFHLDKETEAVFNRFQNGVSLVKSDKKLFKGLFYIAIKDVDLADVEDLKDEFRIKLLQICKRSRENFLTKMYGGMVELAAMPPFTRREYYQESLSEIALTVEEDLEPAYQNGRSFLRDLKLVTAQIAAKDWTPVDLKRVAMKVDILRKHLGSAVREGCLSMSGASRVLVNFDTQEEILDTPIEIEDLLIDVHDTGLELAPAEESISNDKILSDLRSRLDSVFKKRGLNGDQWHSMFQCFVGKLIDRRCERVQSWLCSNTTEFAGNHDLQKLQLEAVAALAELKQGLSVCGCKCSVCFWRCVLQKGHTSDHSCMGNHACAEKCTYCSLEAGVGIEVEECRNLAGHDGDHDCKRRNHSCGKICSLNEKSSNCTMACCLKVGHDGPHKCNSPQHMCKMKCSLRSCKNPCAVPIELGDHKKHACHERFCPKKCIMDGCPRLCGYEDHFHALKSEEHLCGSEHACREKCEADGICEIFTELVRQTRTFQGKKSSFEYEHVSEQNGLRKDCCIPIPAFEKIHKGIHLHTLNPDAVHYCNLRCEACGYFCQRPINHSGLHNTVHGNMRHVNFVSDREEFDINGRQYACGESGIAEMCNMHCKAQGRGHIHLIRCPVNDKLECTSHLYDGSRHETRKYGPIEEISKDELTHETYWRRMRFEDPCSEEDQKEFALCKHLCRSQEHNESDGSTSRSYCTEKLWHPPVVSSGSVASSSGLGCVYEAIVRFIVTRQATTSDDSVSVVLFDTTAVLALEMKEMKEDIVDYLLQYRACGGTSYSSGLLLAEDAIIRGSKDPNVEKKKPTVIFLSDGGNNDGQDPVHLVNRLKQREPRVVLHTIMFGRDPTVHVLETMAAAGNGSFQHSLDEVQLQRSFENLASSLQPNVASLMRLDN
ncbi:hypothetical protein SUGI_0197940 [Cryptomeria japonica]|uniref:uncharacterized protein LOC131036860 isoform X2 n=1 Tax=Cryptomeria japonica TaxID=3369 RepID=UPI002408C0A4|nr:uncharacterized protein LOC131036860 isoform X2 [Cryptomeria japonica]GLJ12793.1 hypothetical protein SUGI_0197940 [Cryptomeria japonica]